MVGNENLKKIEIVKIKMVRERNEKFTVNKVNGPQDGVEIARQFLEEYDRECLIVMALNTKNKVINISVVSVGSLNSSIVHPREVFKTLILSNAASFIIAHNHPSGNSTESREDILITKRLNECAKIMGINLLDHLIIGDGNYTSLKEKGLLE
ncbi:MAG: DNA repair protein RadC [Cetobacterium sp.]|uniref:JAB domain-containing protein n=1 Tax=Bacteria TaxID=2 RepID=UPI002FCAD58E